MADAEFARMHPEWMKDRQLCAIREQSEPGSHFYDRAMKLTENYVQKYPDTEKLYILNEIQKKYFVSVKAFQNDLENLNTPGYRPWSELTRSELFEDQFRKRKIKAALVTSLALTILYYLTSTCYKKLMR